MFKSVIFSVNFLIVLFLGTWLAEDVSVTQDFPERVDALAEFDVTLTINKGAVKGFAKYQQTMPKGIEVTNLEGQGATFTYSDQTIKYIWMSLPEAETFTISYHVKITDQALAAIIMGGKFSYLDDNKRMSFNVPSKEIKIGKEIIQEEIIPDPVVALKRNVTEISPMVYEVSIQVDKENVVGFAKVQDFIPSGSQVEPLETEGSVFSMVDRKAKFVWLNVPPSPSFKVSYQIDLSQADPKDVSAIFGEFSFLHDGKTQTQKIDVTDLSQEPVLAENTNSSETEANNPEEEKEEETSAPSLTENEVKDENETISSEPEIAEEIENTSIETESVPTVNEEPEVVEVKEEPAIKEESVKIEDPITAAVESQPDVQKITSTPQPETGVFYRVQILAGKNSVKSPYFKKKHNYNGEFVVENHEGWIKYTAGKHAQYKQARDSREQIKTAYNFPGPFVVAYNSGERITVQEALMITGQKWLQ